MLVDEVQGVALLHQEVGGEALADDAPGLRRRQIHLRLLRLGLRLRGDGIDARGFCQRCRRAVLPHVRGGGLDWHGRALGLHGPDQGVGGRGLRLGHGGPVLLGGHGLEEGLPSPLPRLRGGAHRRPELRLRRGLGLRQHRVHPAGGTVQRGEGAVIDAVEGVALVQEFDLRLGRMDVHVHRPQGHGDLQHAGGEAAHHHLVFIGLLQRRGEDVGLDIAAVDEEDLIVSVAAGGGGPGDVALHPGLLPAGGELHHLHGRLAAEDRVDGAEQLPVAGGGHLLLAVAQEGDGQVGMGQGLPLHRGEHRRALSAVALHEFHAGGRVVEQVADNDRGALGAPGLAALGDLPRLQGQARPEGRALGAGQQIDLRHRGDGGQGLAPEAQSADGLQILFRADLAGGVAQEGDLRVLRRHAAAVVGHADGDHAAVLDRYGDVFCPRVHGVFQQLLDHGGRTLYHLAGGDQIRHMGGKLMNDAHGASPTAPAASPPWRWCWRPYARKCWSRWSRCTPGPRPGRSWRADTGRSTGPGSAGGTGPHSPSRG